MSATTGPFPDQPSPDAPIPFEEIFSAVQQGDASAQEIAFRRVFPQVVRAIQARFRGDCVVDPEDAALSAFRTILRRGWEFQRQEEQILPTSWSELAGLCVRFAYNKARTALKKQRRGAARQAAAELSPGDVEHSDEAQPTPDDEAIRNEMVAQVRRAVDRLYDELDDKERAILRGKLDGRTSRQIQEQMADGEMYLTQSGVDKRWRRKILPKLQKSLGGRQDNS